MSLEDTPLVSAGDRTSSSLDEQRFGLALPWVFSVEMGYDWVSVQGTSYVVDTVAGSCVQEVVVFTMVREAELVFAVSDTRTSDEGTVLVVGAEDLVTDVTTAGG